jgi:hypothetical protein
MGINGTQLLARWGLQDQFAALASGGGGDFGASLAAASSSSATPQVAPASTPLAPFEADVVSGQLGIQLDRGEPTAVVFFDTTGQKLTQTAFEPASILRKATEFGIPLGDLNGLADKLDAKGVGYKPYQLYPGTRSDAGIDLRDLASGGLGTAYDWRTDVNVGLKGAGAASQLLSNQILAQQLALQSSAVTETTGSNPAAAPTSPGAAVSPVTGQASLVSGQLGIQLDHGEPTAVVFFDANGQKLTQTSFEPASILRKATELGIPLSDLNGLADQLDAKGVGYKPYQLYPGTRSDAGIDLRDLASGGLGTAYDWRTDLNVGLKGAGAASQLQANQALAEQLALAPSAVTQTAASPFGAGASFARVAQAWTTAASSFPEFEKAAQTQVAA